IFARLDQLVGAEPRLHRGDATVGGFLHRAADRGGSLPLPSRRAALCEIRTGRGLSSARRRMIEAAMLWNEPNNKSHWDLEIDPDWVRFAGMARLAGDAIAAAAPDLPRVLGGISPIDPLFIANLAGKGVLDRLDSVAVYGFPLDWHL